MHISYLGHFKKLCTWHHVKNISFTSALLSIILENFSRKRVVAQRIFSKILPGFFQNFWFRVIKTIFMTPILEKPFLEMESWDFNFKGRADPQDNFRLPSKPSTPVAPNVQQFFANFNSKTDKNEQKWVTHGFQIDEIDFLSSFLPRI